MHARSSTYSVCQQHASPSSNMLHCCCARCCAPSCCTSQRQHPASTARSASCWRDDSSTILVDEPTRQQCADHVLAAEAAATRSRRGSTIKRPQNGPSEVPRQRVSNWELFVLPKVLPHGARRSADVARTELSLFYAVTARTVTKSRSSPTDESHIAACSHRKRFAVTPNPGPSEPRSNE